MSDILLTGILLLLARQPKAHAQCRSHPVKRKSKAHVQIFTETFERLNQLIEEQEGEVEMPPLAQMGLMMVDWLDPQKVV